MKKNFGHESEAQLMLKAVPSQIHTFSKFLSECQLYLCVVFFIYLVSKRLEWSSFSSPAVTGKDLIVSEPVPSCSKSLVPRSSPSWRLLLAISRIREFLIQIDSNFDQRWKVFVSWSSILFVRCYFYFLGRFDLQILDSACWFSSLERVRVHWLLPTNFTILTNPACFHSFAMIFEISFSNQVFLSFVRFYRTSPICQWMPNFSKCEACTPPTKLKSPQLLQPILYHNRLSNGKSMLIKPIF